MSNNAEQQKKANLSLRYDEYWLTKGREIIDGSLEGFQKRIGNYISFLNYLAGALFLGGVTYTTYLGSKEWYIFFLFILPLVVVAIAKYKIGIQNTAPDLEHVNMRSPTQINAGFTKIVQNQAASLKSSQEWVGIATGFVLICIPLAIFFKNIFPIEPKMEPYLTVMADSKSLTLQGYIPDTETVAVHIKGTKDKKDAFVVGQLLPDKKSKINESFPLDQLNLKPLTVQVTYMEGDKEKTVNYAVGTEKQDAKNEEVGPTTSKKNNAEVEN